MDLPTKGDQGVQNRTKQNQEVETTVEEKDFKMAYNQVEERENITSCTICEDVRHIGGKNKFGKLKKVILNTETTERVISKINHTEEEKDKLLKIKKIETIERMYSMGYSTTLNMYIPAEVAGISPDLLQKAIEEVAQRIKDNAHTAIASIVGKVLRDVEVTHRPMKTGDSVFVRKGQPKEQKRVLEDQYLKGFRVRQEASKNRGPLGFWKSKIPEQLLKLIIPDACLHEADNWGNTDTTIATKNGHILNYLGWVIWKVFRKLLTKNGSSLEELKELTPPWRPKQLSIFAMDLVVHHEYAASSAQNMVVTVADWWRSYPKALMDVETGAEVAAWGDNIRKPSRKLGKVGKKYEANKAKPLFQTGERWETLTTKQKTLTNFWCQLGCRWDTFSMIRKSHLMIMPANTVQNANLPEEDKATPLHNWDGKLKVNTLVYCFIEKEKIDSHEARWVPFDCNCCDKNNSYTRKVSSRAGKHGYYFRKSKEECADINTDFCLYHGRFGFEELLRNISLPIPRSEAVELCARLGMTLHGPRRTVAIWMAMMIFRYLYKCGMKLFLIDMGWGSVEQMKGYVPKKDVLTYEVLDLYPNHGKLALSKRLPINYKVEKCTKKNDWSQIHISGKSSVEKVKKIKNARSTSKITKKLPTMIEEIREGEEREDENEDSSKKTLNSIGKIAERLKLIGRKQTKRKKPTRKPQDTKKKAEKKASRGEKETEQGEEQNTKRDDGIAQYDSDNSVIIDSDSDVDPTWKAEDLSSDEEIGWGKYL